MRMPRRYSRFWSIFVVAGALPANVAPALSQAPESTRSVVIISRPAASTTARADAGPPRFGIRIAGRARRFDVPSRWQPDRSAWTPGGASGAGVSYADPSPWIAAPVTLAWLFTFDSAVKNWSQTSWQGDFGGGVARLGDILGEGEIMIFVSGGSLFVGAFEGSDGLKRASAVIAGVLAGPINNAALKYIFGRTRPNETDNPLDFHPFSGAASFPSGHVSVPFSIGGALEAATGLEAIAYPFYFAGALTGFARIYDNVHWFSDVVASAVIASIVSRKATSAVLKAWRLEPGLGKGRDQGTAGDVRLRYQRPTGVQASLFAGGTTIGIQLTF